MCKISHSLLRDPVVANDGITYERSQIEAWIRSKGWTAPSPYNNALSVTIRELKPNVNIRQAIHEYKELKAMQTALVKEAGDAREYTEQVERLLKEALDREQKLNQQLDQFMRVAEESANTRGAAIDTTAGNVADNIAVCAADHVADDITYIAMPNITDNIAMPSITDNITDSLTENITGHVTDGGPTSSMQSPARDGREGDRALTVALMQPTMVVIEPSATELEKKSTLAGGESQDRHTMGKGFLVSIVTICAILMSAAFALHNSSHLITTTQYTFLTQRATPLHLQGGTDQEATMTQVTHQRGFLPFMGGTFQRLVGNVPRARQRGRQPAATAKETGRREREQEQRAKHQTEYWLARDADERRQNARVASTTIRATGASEQGGNGVDQAATRFSIDVSYVLIQGYLIGVLLANAVAVVFLRYACEWVVAVVTVAFVALWVFDCRQKEQSAAKTQAFKSKSLARKERNTLRRVEIRQRTAAEEA